MSSKAICCCCIVAVILIVIITPIVLIVAFAGTARVVLEETFDALNTSSNGLENFFDQLGEEIENQIE